MFKLIYMVLTIMSPSGEIDSDAYVNHVPATMEECLAALPNAIEYMKSQVPEHFEVQGFCVEHDWPFGEKGTI